MSEQENKGETNSPNVAFFGPEVLTEDTNDSETTTEAARIARSAPERRQLLCALAEECHGQAAIRAGLLVLGDELNAVTLEQLADYVDQLEERVMHSEIAFSDLMEDLAEVLEARRLSGKAVPA